MQSDKKQVAFRLHACQLSEIQARGGELSGVVRSALDRYFALLSSARRGLKGVFTDGEKGLLLDIENGILHEPASLFAENAVLAMEVEDAEGEMFEKWAVHPNKLHEKLTALSPLEQVATWWHRQTLSLPQPGVESLLEEKGD